MALDEISPDRESQTQAALRAVAGLPLPHEQLEDCRQLLDVQSAF
jgi:hypothetical protein